MTQETPSNLTPVSFRLSDEELRKLMLLGIVHGNRTRAVGTAITVLYEQTLKENAAFRELVAEGTEPAADASEE